MQSATLGVCALLSLLVWVGSIYSALEELDATYDSDNEADYTKMDMVCVCCVV